MKNSLRWLNTDISKVVNDASLSYLSESFLNGEELLVLWPKLRAKLDFLLRVSDYLKVSYPLL
jgi:hypothetical protein